METWFQTDITDQWRTDCTTKVLDQLMICMEEEEKWIPRWYQPQNNSRWITWLMWTSKLEKILEKNTHTILEWEKKILNNVWKQNKDCEIIDYLQIKLACILKYLIDKAKDRQETWRSLHSVWLVKVATRIYSELLPPTRKRTTWQTKKKSKNMNK